MGTLITNYEPPLKTIPGKAWDNAMHRFCLINRVTDTFLKWLIVIGTAAYLIELSFGFSQGTRVYLVLWCLQSFAAVCFTIEYLSRWIDDARDHYRWHYPHSALGIIDLISIMPFWFGFLLPIEWFHFSRTLRVFWLLKFFRYSRSLQLVALGFYRAMPALRPLGFAMFVIGLFCSVVIFETEHDSQPEKFRNMFDAVYFTMVTVATVGYGDLTPITPLGRLTVMVTFATALTVFAGILGVVGASFYKVLDEELDPTIDPIEEFRKERQKQLVRWR
jgi:voltage-gated potassium channel